MKRFHQFILIASFVPLCWLWMMAVHELGHVLAAWSTGGSVVKLVLHPLTISRTDVSPNPKPLIVVWSGPLIGVFLPLLIWVVFHGMRIPAAYLSRVYAGFCLIANGTYVGIGSFDGVGDAGEMLQHGTFRPLLWIFGLVAVVLGLWLWHGQGKHFGLGESRGRVDGQAAYWSLGALLLTVVLMMAMSPRV
jgi:hypothetical protein